jgi:hypothetical protein
MVDALIALTQVLCVDDCDIAFSCCLEFLEGEVER